jgi:hypothetical protein
MPFSVGSKVTYLDAEGALRSGSVRAVQPNGMYDLVLDDGRRVRQPENNLKGVARANSGNPVEAAWRKEIEKKVEELRQEEDQARAMIAEAKQFLRQYDKAKKDKSFSSDFEIRRNELIDNFSRFDRSRAARALDLEKFREGVKKFYVPVYGEDEGLKKTREVLAPLTKAQEEGLKKTREVLAPLTKAQEEYAKADFSQTLNNLKEPRLREAERKREEIAQREKAKQIRAGTAQSERTDKDRARREFAKRVQGISTVQGIIAAKGGYTVLKDPPRFSRSKRFVCGNSLDGNAYLLLTPQNPKGGRTVTHLMSWKDFGYVALPTKNGFEFVLATSDLVKKAAENDPNLKKRAQQAEAASKRFRFIIDPVLTDPDASEEEKKDAKKSPNTTIKSSQLLGMLRKNYDEIEINSGNIIKRVPFGTKEKSGGAEFKDIAVGAAAGMIEQGANRIIGGEPVTFRFGVMTGLPSGQITKIRGQMSGTLVAQGKFPTLSGSVPNAEDLTFVFREDAQEGVAGNKITSRDYTAFAVEITEDADAARIERFQPYKEDDWKRYNPYYSWVKTEKGQFAGYTEVGDAVIQPCAEPELKDQLAAAREISYALSSSIRSFDDLQFWLNYDDMKLTLGDKTEDPRRVSFTVQDAKLIAKLQGVLRGLTKAAKASKALTSFSHRREDVENGLVLFLDKEPMLAALRRSLSQQTPQNEGKNKKTLKDVRETLDDVKRDVVDIAAAAAQNKYVLLEEKKTKEGVVLEHIPKANTERLPFIANKLLSYTCTTGSKVPEVTADLKKMAESNPGEAIFFALLSLIQWRRFSFTHIMYILASGSGAASESKLKIPSVRSWGDLISFSDAEKQDIEQAKDAWDNKNQYRKEDFDLKLAQAVQHLKLKIKGMLKEEDSWSSVESVIDFLRRRDSEWFSKETAGVPWDGTSSYWFATALFMYQNLDFELYGKNLNEGVSPEELRDPSLPLEHFDSHYTKKDEDQFNYDEAQSRRLAEQTLRTRNIFEQRRAQERQIDSAVKSQTIDRSKVISFSSSSAKKPEEFVPLSDRIKTMLGFLQVAVFGGEGIDRAIASRSDLRIEGGQVASYYTYNPLLFSFSKSYYKAPETTGAMVFSGFFARNGANPKTSQLRALIDSIGVYGYLLQIVRTASVQASLSWGVPPVSFAELSEAFSSYAEAQKKEDKTWWQKLRPIEGPGVVLPEADWKEIEKELYSKDKFQDGMLAVKRYATPGLNFAGRIYTTGLRAEGTNAGPGGSEYTALLQSPKEEKDKVRILDITKESEGRKKLEKAIESILPQLLGKQGQIKQNEFSFEGDGSDADRLNFVLARLGSDLRVDSSGVLGEEQAAVLKSVFAEKLAAQAAVAGRAIKKKAELQVKGQSEQAQQEEGSKTDSTSRIKKAIEQLKPQRVDVNFPTTDEENKFVSTLEFLINQTPRPVWVDDAQFEGSDVGERYFYLGQGEEAKKKLLAVAFVLYNGGYFSGSRLSAGTRQVEEETLAALNKERFEEVKRDVRNGYLTSRESATQGSLIYMVTAIFAAGKYMDSPKEEFSVSPINIGPYVSMMDSHNFYSVSLLRQGRAQKITAELDEEIKTLEKNLMKKKTSVEQNPKIKHPKVPQLPKPYGKYSKAAFNIPVPPNSLVGVLLGSDHKKRAGQFISSLPHFATLKKSEQIKHIDYFNQDVVEVYVGFVLKDAPNKYVKHKFMPLPDTDRSVFVMHPDVWNSFVAYVAPTYWPEYIPGSEKW